jgi:hypothetical protein
MRENNGEPTDMADITAKKKSENSIAARVLQSPLFVMASGIGVLILAFAFDTVKSKISVEGVMAGTGVLLLIALLNMITNATINKLHNQDYFDQRLEVLNSIILSNNLNWLVNQKYVQMIEMQSQEVWAFAPELTYAVQPDSDLFKAIQVNLKKGAKYKIFMPNKAETHKIISDYRRLHDFKPGQVEFILVPHEEYVFHTIIVIYDPRSDNPHAIEWLPVEDLVAWLEMDLKHAGRMVGIGEVLIQRYMAASGQDMSFVKELPRAHGKAVVVNEDV